MKKVMIPSTETTVSDEKKACSEEFHVKADNRHDSHAENQIPAVSLSFDDGRGDNVAIVDEILSPLGIPATLNITTGYVDGTCPENLCPSSKQAMTVEDVVHLAKNPLIEIALHGDRHLNTVEDILEGRRKLIRWLGLSEDARFGFASPNCRFPRDQFQSEEYAELRKQLLYLRTGLRITRFPLLRKLSRKAGRVLRLPWLFRLAYADTPMDTRDDKLIYSVPVMKDTSEAQIRALVKHCIRKGSSLTLMFHSISDQMKGEDQWSWSRTEFERLCGYLCQKRQAGELELTTTKELYNRLK